LAVDGSVLMSGSASDWESTGLRNRLRKALSKGLGVPVSHVNVTSSVAGSALVSFVVFQDESYADRASVRAKLMRPSSAARIAELIEAETGADVVAGPFPTKEARVDTRGGRTVVKVTWLSLTPPQVAGIALGVLALCACCGAAGAYRYRARRAARGQQQQAQQQTAGVLVETPPPIATAPAPMPIKVRNGADRLSVQSFLNLSSVSSSSRSELPTA
jgi:hypothetical protein